MAASVFRLGGTTQRHHGGNPKSADLDDLYETTPAGAPRSISSGSVRDVDFGGSGSHKGSRRLRLGSLTIPTSMPDVMELMLWVAATALLALIFVRAAEKTSSWQAPKQAVVATDPLMPLTLISYSYFEKDDTQLRNLEFFLRHGHEAKRKQPVELIYTVSGRSCSACPTMIDSMGLFPVPDGAKELYQGTITEAYRGGRVTLLRRQENVGMDFGNHNISLTWLATHASQVLTKAKYFLFINSSVQGPFIPTYFSAHSHWSQAFTSLINDEVKVVGPSLVCLPAIDEGGPAPRLESFVFATDHVGLRYLTLAGVFDIHIIKRDIILNGEYGLTRATFEAGYKVSTLLFKYDINTDWQDPANWNCNNQVHPSRDCSYGGISQHPFETVFIKSSWGVSTEYVQKYALWADAKLEGTATKGRFDRERYLLASNHSSMCGTRDPLLAKGAAGIP